jgi:hypothetical protein
MNNALQGDQQMHNQQFRALSLSTAAALLLTALPAVSNARTNPGSIGVAAIPADADCLSLSNSAIVNTCSHNVRVDFPLTHDSSGTLNAQVRAQGPIGGVACEISWWSGLSFRAGTTQSLTAANVVQLLSVSVTASFTTDSVFIGCTLQPNARVHTLLY